MTNLKFTTFDEFLHWKEIEDESTHTTYIKGDRTYNPTNNGKETSLIILNVLLIVYRILNYNYLAVGKSSRLYYMCCRDEGYRENKQERKTDKERPRHHVK